VLVPGDDDRAEVHRVIYDELCRGVVLERSRGAFRGRHRAPANTRLRRVILGCTEITLLVDAACSPLPVFDSTALHAAAAVDWMLDPNEQGD
jgi:aspartate racemase